MRTGPGDPTLVPPPNAVILAVLEQQDAWQVLLDRLMALDGLVRLVDTLAKVHPSLSEPVHPLMPIMCRSIL